MAKIWIECQKCKGKIEYELDDLEPDVQYIDCNECGYTNLIYDYLIVEEATKQGLVVHDRSLDRWEWVSNKKINEVFERKSAIMVKKNTTNDKLQAMVDSGKYKYCDRCDGLGNYSYNQRTGTTCFKCGGNKILKIK